MQKEIVKFADSCIFEGMTSLRAILDGARDGVNSRRIKRVLYDAQRSSKLARDLSYLRAMASERGFVLEETDVETIERLSVGNSHGGVIAECTDRTIDALPPEALSIDEHPFCVMIEGIEDPYNFGYAIRSLYAMGVSDIILPPRNWMSAAGVVARSSAGASERVRLYTSDAVEAANAFHKAGYTVVCAEEKTEHILPETPLNFPIFLIVGGEKRGVSSRLLEACDLLVKIPYGRAFRASLSAASASTIVAYEIYRQNRK